MIGELSMVSFFLMIAGCLVGILFCVIITMICVRIAMLAYDDILAGPMKRKPGETFRRGE